jgi:site-specific DNA-cytosine methylase
MENIQLLYIDLFCGAGGTSTGVESVRAKVFNKDVFQFTGIDSTSRSLLNHVINLQMQVYAAYLPPRHCEPAG